MFEIINDGVTPNEVALYGVLWGGENDEYVFSRVKFIEDELGTFQAQCLGCGGFQ